MSALTQDSLPVSVAFDLDAPRCRAHRGIPAEQMTPGCSLCEEARAWADRRRAQLAEAAARMLAACVMCDGAGQRWDPATHIAVCPRITCDHETPHGVVVADLAAAEEAAEQARAARPAPAPVPSTREGRDRAQALFLASRRRRAPVPDGVEAPAVGEGPVVPDMDVSVPA